MDPNRFDRFTRAFAGALSRRSTLSVAFGGAISSLLGVADMEAKKRKKGKNKKKCKRCGPCEQCKKGKCKPKKNGAGCAGDCASPSGDGGYTVSVGAETRYKGKPLRAQQTVQPIGGAGKMRSQLDLTLGGEALLAIATESNGGAVTVTFTYGDAFQGINQARFTNDGATVSGEIDGRAIVPLSADGDPSQAQFADGAPPPDIGVDPKLAETIESVLRQVKQKAEACDHEARRGQAGAEAHGTAQHGNTSHARSRRGTKAHSASSRSKVSPRAHPENSLTCLALYIPCQTGSVACIYGAAAGCAAALFFYGACVAIGLGLCLVASERCRRGIRHNAPCCPVACGGDPENLIFGDDPGCCEKGETCLDPNSSHSGCCAAGMVNCGGECCSAGRCTNGFCCRDGGVCGNQCCGAFDQCCGGTTCCTGICNGNICCRNGELPCGSGCCNGTCLNGSCCPSGQVVCNGACCPSGYDCQNNQCVQICTPGQIPCAGRCCSGGQDCYRCPNGARICAFGPCIN